MKKTIYFLSVLCLSFFTADSQDYQQRANRVDSLFKVYAAKKMFYGSVLIAKDGKILLDKGYGMANYSYDIPNTGQTKFKLASVSKQFTAMCIMILQEQGKLSTTDKLTKYISDYPKGDQITIHQLLTHTSGIVSFTSLPIYDSVRTREQTLEQEITYFKNKPLEFEPGTQFKYSNSGYLLLAYIIEKASGKSYQQFVSSAIFEPLGMKNSGAFEGRKVIKNLAVGYAETEDGGVEEAPFIDMSVPSGAGALYSTVEDLFLWDQALNTEKLVKKATIDKIFTADKDRYAYGWFIDKYKEHLWYNHSGGIEGFSTIINRFPEDKLTIIILKNIDNQNFFAANRNARFVMFGDPLELPVERKAVKVDEKVLKTLCGDYELMPGFVMTFSTDKGRFYAQATGQDKGEIFAESDYKYFFKLVNAQFEFTKNQKGEIESVTLYQNGKVLPGKKIK